MDARLIHPVFPKSFRSAPHTGPSVTVIATLLAALIVLALLFPSVGRIGVESQDQPLRPLPGLGL